MAGEAWAMLETDLEATLESDFAAPVVLTSPDGIIIATSLHGGPLYGAVRYDSIELHDGEPIVVKKPNVVLRISSLSRVPKMDEAWSVSIPTSPADPTPKTFLFDGKTRAPIRNDSIGFLKLFLQAAVQS